MLFFFSKLILNKLLFKLKVCESLFNLKELKKIFLITITKQSHMVGLRF